MKWGLLGVRLGILGVNIVIIAILVMSVVPLATDGIDVEIPEGHGDWTVTDSVIAFNQPVRIYNGGYYDFEDFSVHFYLEDDHGNVITDYASQPVDIVTGKRTTVNINMVIDLDDIGEDGMRNLVFNGTTFDMLAEIQTSYMMKLLTMSANLSEQMEWDPMIHDYGIRDWDIHYSLVGTRIQLDVPYYIDASDMLNDIDVGIDCRLRNYTSTIAETTDLVTLYGHTEGTLQFLISEEASQWMLHNDEELIFVLQIEVEGVTADHVCHYQWYAPM
jgi:hypothetical protein